MPAPVFLKKHLTFQGIVFTLVFLLYNGVSAKLKENKGVFPILPGERLFYFNFGEKR
jgi:hypothetical protein